MLITIIQKYETLKKNQLFLGLYKNLYHQNLIKLLILMEIFV